MIGDHRADRYSKISRPQKRSSRGLSRYVSEAAGVISDHPADFYAKFPRPRE